MVEEAYCNPEIAELLREKGMDKECFTHYIQKNNSDGTSEAVTTCTQQRAMRWLREVHNIFIENCITRNQNGEIDNWCKVNTINDLTPMSDKHPFNVFIVDSENSCSSFEKACETAIKYCLENLI